MYYSSIAINSKFLFIWRIAIHYLSPQYIAYSIHFNWHNITHNENYLTFSGLYDKCEEYFVHI